MYSHLEKKEIKLIGFEDKRGLVAGCDKDVGITVVNAEDHNDYIMCLIGPSSPLWKGREAQDRYEELFSMIVRQLETGTYDAMEARKIISTLFDRGPTAADCSFGQ